MLLGSTKFSVRLLITLSVVILSSLGFAPPAAAGPRDFFAATTAPVPTGVRAGDVLATRTLSYHIRGMAMPVRAIQLIYRTTDARLRPELNVASILLSPNGNHRTAVAYQSFYDSLDPADGPSRAIAGVVTRGGAVNDAEGVALATLLLQGHDVIVADIEGPRAVFAVGPAYGMATLDAIRAALRSPATGLGPRTRIGLIGYSGGAIATNWAAALAPGYAPEIDRRIVGAAEGGVLVAPAHNLRYIDGSSKWAGVSAMAVIGVARAYGIDMAPYLNRHGVKTFSAMSQAPIGDVTDHYPGLTWRGLMRPSFADPDSVVPVARAMRALNLGSAPTPTMPMFIGQGSGRFVEGTLGNKPGIGPGDGVMVSGDVRALAYQYCRNGNRAITYQQYADQGHTQVVAVWLPAALGWLGDRLAGLPVAGNCRDISPGNSLA